jgi:2,5-diketo-D-gluconate reductase A
MTQYIKLHDGNRMPQLGLGLWQVPDDDAAKLVVEAFKAGYRSIDGAQIYQNEKGLGQGIKAAGLPREEIFITTKIWNSEQGHRSTIQSFEVSLNKLGLDYLDLLLIHWPAAHRGLYVETWKTLIELQQTGRVKSIGVSNFHQQHLEKIVAATNVVPVVNQIEVHPRFQQKALRKFNAELGIQTEAWSPLGQGQLIHDPLIGEIAKKHGKSNAQIIIRWHLDQGLIVIPKSSHTSRIRENFAVFDFMLDKDDMHRMEVLDDAQGRIGPNPETAQF